MNQTTDLMRLTPGVDKSDWLKTFAIILFVVDHTGYFFIDDASWWSVFTRGPSPIQPPEPIAGSLRFLGRHTLEIYVIQLAGFELIVKFLPELAA